MNPKESLTSKVVKSGAWIYGRFLATSIINIFVMAILARRLTPSEFGIVALASVILKFLVVIGSEGVNEFVIYDNKEGKELRTKAAFWMNFTFCFAAAIVGWILVPFISKFYDESILKAILNTLLLKYLLDNLSKVPDAILQKKFDFDKLVIRDTVLEIASSIISVILAFAGFGVWSLVLPGLIVAPIRTIIVFGLAKWLPGFKMYLKEWPQIFRYSSFVIGGTITSYLISDGDTLLLGKLLGKESLGLYNIAFVAAMMVPRNITAVANRIALPALSAVSSDIRQLKEVIERILNIIAAISFPLLIGLFVLADDFVLLLYGSQWKASILPLRIMIVFALRYSVGAAGSALWKAVGRTDISFKLGIITAPLFLLAVWIGSFKGIVGAAIAVTVVRTLMGLIGFKYIGSCIGSNLCQVLKTMLPAFLASSIMGVIVFVLKIILEEFCHFSHFVMLLSCVTVGGLVYLFLLRTAFKGISRELAKMSAPLAGPFQPYILKILKLKNASEETR